MGYQKEMFSDDVRPLRTSKFKPRNDGEHFDFLCRCGCENFNLPYRLFKLWRDEQGAWHVDYPCPRCKMEHPIKCPLDFELSEPRG